MHFYYEENSTLPSPKYFINVYVYKVIDSATNLFFKNQTEIFYGNMKFGC